MAPAAPDTPPKSPGVGRLLLLFAALHAAVWLFVVGLAAANGPAFQVEIFRGYADRIAAGQTPYADFPYEYPPLSLVVAVLPRLLASEPTAYAALFGAGMLLLDILILWALSRIGRVPLVLYGVGMLLFWRLPFIRHDLFPVALATLGSLAVLRGRWLWGAVLWGAGGAVKLYPMVAVPALAAGASVRGIAKRWAVAGAVFVAGIGWGVVAFGREALMFFGYHSDRPAMIESLPANLLLFLPDARIVNTFGSFNVVGPADAWLVPFFEAFQLAATVFVLCLVWWQGRGRMEPRELAVRGAAAATLAFALFGKVLSPHFLFWPLPLLAIATATGGVRHPRTTWALFFLVIGLTTAVNEQYWAIGSNLAYFTALLTLRNLLLIPLFALVLLPPRKDKRHHPEDRRGAEGV